MVGTFQQEAACDTNPLPSITWGPHDSQNGQNCANFAHSPVTLFWAGLSCWAESWILIVRVERTLGTLSPSFSFSPQGLKPQELGCYKGCGSRPLPPAAYPVLETLCCVCSFTACCGWPIPEWVERTQERNGSFSTCAKAESRGTEVAGWAAAHTVSALLGLLQHQVWSQMPPLLAVKLLVHDPKFPPLTRVLRCSYGWRRWEPWLEGWEERQEGGRTVLISFCP